MGNHLYSFSLKPVTFFEVYFSSRITVVMPLCQCQSFWLSRYKPRLTPAVFPSYCMREEITMCYLPTVCLSTPIYYNCFQMSQPILFHNASISSFFFSFIFSFFFPSLSGETNNNNKITHETLIMLLPGVQIRTNFLDMGPWRIISNQ